MLDGVAVGQAIRAEVRPDAEAFAQAAGRPPGIALVLVGNDPGSELYVGSKLKSAGENGIRADLERLPATAGVDDLLRLVDRLNRSDVHDAILVQSPLPKEMGPDAERRVFEAIDPAKDVDGFHPANVGRLVQGRASLVACTPSGVIELLDRSGIAIAGRRAVVIGRSDIVGKPMALLLLNRHATVTVCHSRTVDLPAVAREADILVAALGRPAFVTPEFVKAGATVIDVGTTPVADREFIARLFAPGSRRHTAFEKRGSLVLGDVHPAVEAVAGALTPVPGGVGPLTIAMLLKNTVRAAQDRLKAG
ncbi:MAG TPA: bifunctional 5,10-methylenetetrahydrofolate dehydrogenase/5,10-methenyltetrahydrofolate cyclohydrolase [Vicinamibacterales bacterium]|nr:bifunctional 5,10-methylenetetrahydrofolate dehydrogenase/5,10-methenyltetrahydrofolate cyclohydrolase [Vicinamibacterales bacterium]